MSSETSIETQGAADGLHPWQLFTLAGLIGATIVVFVSRGETPSGIILLSLIIFTAAVVGVATWRTLAPLAGKDDPTGPQILGGRTRAAVEREKALVLRTIKELEFDRAMGKVSDKDFAEMSTRLRSRAAGLMRQLDAGSGYREKIEEEIQKRLKQGSNSSAHVGRALSGSPGAPDTGVPAAPARWGGVARPTGGIGVSVTGVAVASGCAACGTHNDPDARFCKNCGARMETAS